MRAEKLNRYLGDFLDLGKIDIFLHKERLTRFIWFIVQERAHIAYSGRIWILVKQLIFCLFPLYFPYNYLGILRNLIDV